MATADTGRARIAIVAHDIHDSGGTERVTAELIRRLHHDHRVLVVSAQLGHDLRPLVEWRRVRVPRRPLAAKLATFAALAGAEVRRADVDLVHTVGAIIPNRVDVATVHFCHAGFRAAGGSLAPPDAPPTRRVSTATARAMALAGERWCYRHGRVRALAAVSQGVADEIRAHYPGVDVYVTPNGVDSVRFRPDPAKRAARRSAAQLADDDVVALFVGGDWDRKGLGIAIEAVAHARGQGATTLRLWVVGQGDRQRFEAMAGGLGVAEVVRFHGSIPDTEEVYRAADVFVLPSLYEAFSLVTLEAAASALPIVVCEGVSGVAELIGDTEAGLIVPRQTEAFAAALVKLAADRNQRVTMGQSARARAMGFSWAHSADQLRELYRYLLRAG